MTKNTANIMDRILLKFIGNISIEWKDLQSGSFNDIAPYDTIESGINLLIADEMILRKHDDPKKPYLLGLTDRGFATMTNLKEFGYKSKYNREKKDRIIRYATFSIALATFLILCFNRLKATFYPHLENHLQSIEAIKQPTPKSISRNPISEIRSDSQTNIDRNMDKAKIQR
jgi:hypothetical protein